MIPFLAYRQTYVTKKTMPALEKKFSEIEKDPSKFYNEINIKRLSTDEKKYRVFVPLHRLSVFNTPFTFLKTTMIVELSEYGEKTKIRVKVRPNFIYLLGFLLVITGFVINFFWKESGITIKDFAISTLCIVTTVFIDRVSKNVLTGTFERLLK